LNNIAIEYKSLGQFDEALDFYNRALEIQQQLGDQERVGRVLHNMGVVYRDTGDPAQALELHLRALEIREQIGVPRSIARTLSNIGSDYRDLGELEKAAAYFQRSIGMWEEIGSKPGLVEALTSIAELHRQVGSYEAAREALERALALATEAGLQLSSALRELVEVYGALGLSREMLEAFQQYDASTKERYTEEKTRSIAEMQARFDADQKEKEIELLRQQQALQALELERQRGTRRALVGGFGLVLLILLLVFNRFRLKAREALMAETVKQEREVSARLR
ncbi:MAG: tetratricopeptide repeat protein, partial [Planctomycetes bacterium]|nr:tetratricopeptide repeat protein [Planctomycetota bacterium]